MFDKRTLNKVRKRNCLSKLLFSILILASVTCKSQGYINCLNDSNTWYVYDFASFTTDEYSISSKKFTYKGLEYRVLGLPPIWNNITFIREDTLLKRLIYLKDTTDNWDEIIACDFALKQGDSIEMFNYDSSISKGFLKVDTITDTLQSPFGKVRIWHMTLNGYPRVDWAEGIGVLTNPIFYWINSVHDRLDCFFKDSILVYQSQWSKKSNECILITQVESNLHTNDVSSFPNPANNYLLFTSSSFDGLLNIFESSGKLVLNRPFQERVDISNLPSGIYYIKVISDSKVIYSSIQIIK